MLNTKLLNRLCQSLLCIIFVCFCLQATAQEYEWNIRAGGILPDQINDIALDESGNVYLIGNFQGSLTIGSSPNDQSLSSNGKDDIILAKYDSLGNLTWAFSLGNTEKDLGNAIDLDGNGNLYVTGSFTGEVDFNPGLNEATLNAYSGSDAFLAKYDADGNYQWALLIGGEEGVGSGHDVKVHPDGDIVLAGQFGGLADFDPGADVENLHPTGAFLAKYDDDGDYGWAFNLSDHGGILSIEEIGVDFAGDIYITGSLAGRVDFGGTTSEEFLISKGITDIFLARYDQNGAYQWAFTVGTNDGVGIANSLALDNSGNIALTGFYLGEMDFDPSGATQELNSGSNTDIFIAKYTRLGEILWANSIGSSQGDGGTALALDDANNLYVSGFFCRFYGC